MTDRSDRELARPAAPPAAGARSPVARILMSPPDHYGIEYEINPWMRRSQQADQPGAARQWLRLRETLAAAGATMAIRSPGRSAGGARHGWAPDP